MVSILRILTPISFPAGAKPASSAQPAVHTGAHMASAPEAASRLSQIVEGKAWMNVAHAVDMRLRVATRKGRGGEEFCQRVASLLPPTVRGMLWDGVAEGKTLKLHQVQKMATALGIEELKAERILERWQWALHVGPFAISKEEWEKPTVSLRPLIYRRLREAFIGGALLDPRLIGEALEREAPQNHPAVATFHNVILGTGRDLPRLFVMHLAAAIDRISQCKLLGGWEEFWERQAEWLLWNMKPIYAPPVGDIMGAMEYAWQMGWGLKKFREWLVAHAPLKPWIPFSDIFDAVIDREVLEGRSSKSGERPQASDLKKSLSSGRAHFFGVWGGKFEHLAIDLGRADAVRPVSQTRLQFARSREMDVLRRRLLKEVKGQPLPIQELHQILLNNQLTDDARMLANVCKGIDSSERMPPNYLVRDHLSLSGMYGLQRKYETLATSLGYPMKKKST